MAIWNKNKSSPEGILSGKELRDLIKEREQEKVKTIGSFSTISQKNYYDIGFWITAVIAFIACWIYAIAHYGFFLGVGLGWIPSLIIAIIAGLIWPLIAVVLMIGIIIVVYLVYRGG